MSRYLRTVSTRRLLAIIVGFATAVAAGAAIAVAAASGGPVPPKKPLANAIRSALGGPEVTGITARVSFTNHLIDSSNIQGSDPILTGATGRLWLSPSDHRLRLELQSERGDAQVVVNNGSFWVYDPSGNTVYEGTLPKGVFDHTHGAGKPDKLPSVAQIQSDLNRAARHVDLSGAIPGDVAGHAAYTIRVSPKHSGGLIGAAEFAWDAARGIPLRIAVYARNDSSPVLELKATDISYGKVPASDFNVSPPSNAKVVKVATPQGKSATPQGKSATPQGKSATPQGKSAAAADGMHTRKAHHEISGVKAVQSRLPFKLNAPSTLVGLQRRNVTLLDWKGTPAAIVAYGQNLGGIAVIEQRADKGGSRLAAKPHGDQAGLSLPTVSINGITGQELDTALGTMVRFTRAGVTYTVVGSVPPVAADQAARAL
jgi:outer membrane lipoprotein-sorting protein